MNRSMPGLCALLVCLFASVPSRANDPRPAGPLDGAMAGGLTVPAAPRTARYHVSLTGADEQPCTGGGEADPFASIQRAIRCARPGDTVFLRGGRYHMPTSPENAGFVYLQRSGTRDAPITFMSHPGEWAVLDFSAFTGGVDQERVFIEGADWLVLRDLEIHASPQQGIYLGRGADHNLFLNLVIRESWGSGLQIFRGSRNRVVCSDALDSGRNNTVDPGNSDGFGSVGQGGPSVFNEFHYNLADGNADDGFDGWVARRSVFVGNVASRNGHLGGNGRGFKLGPGPVPNGRFGIGTGWTSDPPESAWFRAGNVVRRNIAHGNRVGFDTNSGAGNRLDNNTAWDNRTNFAVDENPDNPNSGVNVLRNNLSHEGATRLSGARERRNSWNLSVEVPRFASLAPSSAAFLSLDPESPAIDRGVRWSGVRYDGSAPDLGALELGRKIARLRASCPQRP